MIIKTKAYPRAGLVGNPSDGYYGKTISFCFSNFRAEVTLYQTPELEILPNMRDHSVFSSIEALVDDVSKYGYYGGIRLLKAAVKKFYEYCAQNRIELDKRNFTIKYSSNIPHQVGLAGSSAIITACMRALMSFFQVKIPKPVLATLVLSVENEELQITAGLQDRVAQAYEGLVYMDFEKQMMTSQGHGNYIEIDHNLLPPLYIAYMSDLSEVSDVFHNNIRDRFDRGEKAVVDSMRYWAALTDKVKLCLNKGNKDKLGSLLNKNFDQRKKIYKISEANVEMVELARKAGASAKFTGSGGAIVGTYTDERMFKKLQAAFKNKKIKIIKPKIVKTSRRDVI
ncbi:MAG: mevalonate kinase family protein [Planctomycetota bacterium]|jgi:glucuronokinase